MSSDDAMQLDGHMVEIGDCLHKQYREIANISPTDEWDGLKAVFAEAMPGSGIRRLSFPLDDFFSEFDFVDSNLCESEVLEVFQRPRFRVKRLVLDGVLSPDAIAKILRACPNVVNVVACENCRFSGRAVFEAICSCRQLISLVIGDKHIVSSDIEVDSAISHVERLTIMNGCMKRLDSIAFAFPRLQLLSLRQYAEDSTLSDLPCMQSLEDLQVAGECITDYGLQFISKLHRLQSLIFERSQHATQHGLLRLRQCAYLRDLTLRDMRITCEHVAAVSTIRQLQSLILCDGVVYSSDDELVSTMSRMGHLRRLSILGSSVSEEAEHRIMDALPNTAVRIIG